PPTPAACSRRLPFPHQFPNAGSDKDSHLYLPMGSGEADLPLASPAPASRQLQFRQPPRKLRRDLQGKDSSQLLSACPEQLHSPPMSPPEARSAGAPPSPSPKLAAYQEPPQAA